MKLIRLTLLFVALLTTVGSAQSAPVAPVAGAWKAVFVGPKADQPKMFNAVLFDFSVNGRTLTGTALMGNWPGLAPLTDGTIDGNRFHCVAIGKLGSSSGYPKMTFDGTVDAGTMTLTMTWEYVDSRAPGRQLKMEGKRTAAQ